MTLIEPTPRPSTSEIKENFELIKRLLEQLANMCLKTIFVYSQQLHLLHLFERLNVPASAFPWSFQFIPWKTALQGNYFATLFPCKIFQEIYFVTLFPCK